MADSFYTIISEGKGLVREKMSRFLSFALHVENAEEAAAIIKEYQNKYHDARHVCWAYMLGPQRTVWQLSDNGEPSGTAGKPILGQINSKGLTDVLVVVVRYFGGIKLGTSGLIMAYREAAREALENAEIREFRDMQEFEIEFAYEDLNGIMRMVKSGEIKIIEKKFDNICRMTLSVGKDDFDAVAGILGNRGAKIKK